MAARNQLKIIVNLKVPPPENNGRNRGVARAAGNLAGPA